MKMRMMKKVDPRKNQKLQITQKEKVQQAKIKRNE